MIKGYVGIPFKDGGRDRDGFDCYGLVRFVLFAEAGIELPTYDLVSANDTLRVMRCIERERSVRIWNPVQKPQPLDVVLMAHCRRPELLVHVGIMVSTNQMLHCEESAGTHLTDIDQALVKARIRGFFRHHRMPSMMTGVAA